MARCREAVGRLSGFAAGGNRPPPPIPVDNYPE
jgi:hypothetical protein